MATPVLSPFDLAAEAAPATPAAGSIRLYAKTSDKHLHQIDDAGVDTDLTATGTVTLKSASIPFVDGDTTRIVTISDVAVTSSSKILFSITRPSSASLPNYTLVQSKVFHSDSGVTLAGTLDFQPTVGNTLVLLVGSNTGNMNSVVTPNIAWTRILNGGVNGAREVWLGQITGGAGQGITVTLPGTGRSMGACIELGGVLLGAPLDQSNSATGSSATLSSGSVTPGKADEILVALGVAFSAAGLGAPTGGFSALAGTPVASATLQMAVAYLVQTAAAAASTTWSMSSGAWDGGIVSLFPAPIVEDEEYIYVANVLNVQNGSFDVEISATAMGFEEPLTPPNETVTFAYVLG